MTEQEAGFWPQNPEELLDTSKAFFKERILKEEIFQLLVPFASENGNDVTIEPFFDDQLGFEISRKEIYIGKRSGLLVTEMITKRLPLMSFDRDHDEATDPQFLEAAKLLGYTDQEINDVIDRFKDSIARFEESLPPNFAEIDPATSTWRLSTSFR